MVTIKANYNGHLRQHLLTMAGYHNTYVQWTTTITSTYNDRLPYHILAMAGFHKVYMQWTVTMTSTYNDWLPKLRITMGVTIASSYNRW
jgi:hypothetical protein